MRALLDTHVLLWALADDRRLSAAHRALIGQGGAELYVSAATIWEISVKRAAGTLRAPKDLAAVAMRAGCRPLAISWQHVERAGELPPHHADPFDRLLIAQAEVERIPLATNNARMAAYGVEII